MTPNEKKFLKFTSDSWAAMKPLVSACTTPIYAMQNKKPVPCGTGTLFRIADQSFLVTASHVRERAIDCNAMPLFICDHESKGAPIGLGGTVASSSEEYDIDVWALEPQTVKGLKNRTFLNLTSMLVNPETVKKGWFTIAGFPSCWTERDDTALKLHNSAFIYGTVLYEGPTDSFMNFNPKIHVLFEYTPSGISDDGKVVTHPQELGGISGCSIWQVFPVGKNLDRWTVNTAKIVAVQTGLYGKGAIFKGTRWDAVVQLIYKGFPALRSALEIHLRPVLPTKFIQ